MYAKAKVSMERSGSAWKGQHVMGRGRSEKQKQKLLYMAQLLYERTDEDHPVTTQEVIDYLEANGIRSVRKPARSPQYPACHRRTGELRAFFRIYSRGSFRG